MSGTERAFAVWLENTLRSRGMRQADLARTLGIADVQVSRWRRGQVVPSLPNLQRLATVLGVPRATLEPLAGYPADRGVDDEDLAQRAELEAHQARLRQAMVSNVPPALWPAYVQACEALAETLGDSYRELDPHHREGARADAAPLGFPRPDARQ